MTLHVFLESTMMIQPSAQWQHWIFIAALFWLLFEMWRGWRLGMIRGIVKILLLIVSSLTASAAAAATSAALAIFFRTPSTAISATVAAFAGLSIYFFGNFLTGFLLKRKEYHHGLLRTISGIGGACCGLLFGLFFLWGGVSLVRSLGLFGEMRLLQASRRGSPMNDEPLACHLVRLERSLEMGPVGQFLVSTDLLSPSFYENTQNSMKVMEDPEAFERFLHSPNVDRLLQNQKLERVLCRYEELLKSVKVGNIPLLLHDPDIQALLHDARFLQEIKQFDLSQALDYALKRSPSVQQSLP